MRIFLSHSSKDRKFVNKLALDLRAHGFEVWYSGWVLGVGDSLADAVQTGIQQASWLIVVLSPDSVKSRWVREELNAGFAKQLADDRVYILPVLYKGCEIPVFLQDRIYADFREGYAAGFSRLLSTLTLVYHPEMETYVAGGRQSSLDECLRDLAELARKSARSVTIDHLLNSVLESELARSGQAWGTVRTFSPNISRWVLKAAVDGKGTSSISFPELPEACEVRSLEGVWRGLAGKLRLSCSGDQVTGKYDWLGYDYSGNLTGIVDGDKVSFDWSWDMSGARGSGMFHRRTSESLTGGWWYKYEELDARTFIASSSLPPRHWEFVRSPIVIESRAPRQTQETSFSVNRLSRNKSCPRGSGKKYKNCCGH